MDFTEWFSKAVLGLTLIAMAALLGLLVWAIVATIQFQSTHTCVAAHNELRTTTYYHQVGRVLVPYTSTDTVRVCDRWVANEK